jgi:hypothetical protein
VSKNLRNLVIEWALRQLDRIEGWLNAGRD